MPHNDRMTVFHDDGTKGQFRLGKTRGFNLPGGYIGTPFGRLTEPYGRKPGQIARGRR